MSELITMRTTDMRSALLATTSALALVTYVAATDRVLAQDAAVPTVWIELGGQMESVQGTSTRFLAPFMTALSPTPDVYTKDIFSHTQRPPKLSFGFEGKAVFQPANTDWIFSAAIRYGRSQADRHVHQQGPVAVASFYGKTISKYAAPFADAKTSTNQSQMILDFDIGRDIGIGRFGDEGSSTLSAGVRFAQFSTTSAINESGRPKVNVLPAAFNLAVISFYNYTMIAHAERNFHGVGPSLSWTASAAVVGNKEAGEVTLDWGINGAVLFGRQKAKASHTTQGYLLPYTPYVAYIGYYYTRVYQHPHHATRSRSVVIPNVGGFAGVSIRYPNAKFSIGYRADFFFGAMDTGIDEQQTKDLGFYGPFATISMGLP